MTAQRLTFGLINWYPFKKGASITFVGDCTEEFRRDILQRGVVEKRMPPYDYIIAVRAVEEAEDPVELLCRLQDDLTEGGHLFLACENRFSLSYFAGEHDPYTNRVMDGIENYPGMTKLNQEGTKGRCYARFELEGFLRQAGFATYRGYSILPGLLMPQQIYHWDCLPEENVEVRYTALYHHPESIFLDTAKAYDSLVQNGMFHQMAPAYLIDCCKTADFYPVRNVTTSMDRGVENATATVICEDDKVYKFALYPEGNQRIENLAANMRQLQERGIRVVSLQECEILQDTPACEDPKEIKNLLKTYDGKTLACCVMPYINAPTGLAYLRELAFSDTDAFIAKTCEFLDAIVSSSEEVLADASKELVPLYKKAYIDMVPLNSFYQDGAFIFFDQEFAEENYPIGVVLARALSIIYMGDRRLEELVPIAYFERRYGIEEKMNIYLSMGTKYIQELRNRQNLISYNRKHLLDFSTIEVNKQRINYSAEEYQRLFINLMSDIAGKWLFVFGSGMWARKFIAEYTDVITIEALLDNKEEKQGQVVDGVMVESPRILEELDPDSYKVFICIKQYDAVLRQLLEAGAKNYGIYNPNVERPAASHRGVSTAGVTFDNSSNCGCSGKASASEEVSSNMKESESGAESEAVIGKQADVPKPYHVGYIAGVFDLFHIGHLNLLRRAKEQCDYLIVGVVSDEQASHGKAHAPYVSEKERAEIVAACRYVDEAFLLSPLASGTRDVYRKYHFEVQFSGSDYEKDPTWLEEQAWLRERGSDMVFFPYTKSTSSTKLKEAIGKK